MRRRTFLGAAAAAFAIAPANAAAAPAFAFENGRWFDGETFRPRTMFSSGGRFTPRRQPAAQALDLAGAFIVPPFADSHNHSLGFHSPAMDRAVVERFIADGVLYARMLGPTGLDDGAKAALGLNRPAGLDVAFADGQITGIGGHPFQLHSMLVRLGVLQGLTVEQLNGTTHWQIGSAAELEAKWPQIRRLRGDILKVVLGQSENYATNRGTTSSGLDPALLPIVVAKAHREGLPVAVHINSAADFRLALRSGVDQFAHPPGVGSIDPEDAALAARRRTPVMTTLAGLESVPPEVFAPYTPAEIRERCQANVRLLRAAGVPIIVGSDNPRDTSVAEIAFLRTTKIFDDAELLRMWCTATPAAIFPRRRLGRFENGFEASFLALDGDPLADWSATRRIRLRVKQGEIMGGRAS